MRCLPLPPLIALLLIVSAGCTSSSTNKPSSPSEGGPSTPTPTTSASHPSGSTATASSSSPTKKIQVVELADLRSTVDKDFRENRAAATRKYSQIAIQFTVSATQVTDTEGGNFSFTSVGEITVGALLLSKYPENQQALKIKRGDYVTIKGLLEAYDYDDLYNGVLLLKTAKIVSIRSPTPAK